ncbi:hypothetical protein NY2A_b785R [Paramecium bursaria Chlorella virus NY2A]|uniref:Uncharacterized protein b785R n=1 Tax=Paramecium bursaria Chlorella virus NY2A TaxID=46021 RepID=A7IXW0_PBCVN|nr:hypothetical protein NY2A_b785R [Paramecium bursaria Chlorella virus NY2A]YP_001498790.1 hypothetical protein AR158_C709R [Paramecium bursaria Chlorella virus AR158]ABT15184.1 hypothetical protein NY2A_b785R [Paramecium bursaria Chlorella virus NY2A]ABU44254.1 hypothetical protein AR158_C709R [Paramecium bursaria Chlorella virus AR158]
MSSPESEVHINVFMRDFRLLKYFLASALELVPSPLKYLVVHFFISCVFTKSSKSGRLKNSLTSFPFLATTIGVMNFFKNPGISRRLGKQLWKKFMTRPEM